MEFITNYNFYCGTSRGFLASTVWRKDDTNVPKPHYNVDYKGDEISSFEFGRSTNEIVVGTVKGNIRIYDSISRSYSHSGVLCRTKASEVVGSGIIQDNLIYCQKNGIVTIWHPEYDRTTNFTIPTGNDGDIQKFRRNEYRDNLFALAGHKFEYTLWDMEHEKVIFAAKSLPADQLYQLPQTTFANDLCTLNFGGGHVGAIVTAEGVTMLYDDRAQRRPVFIMKKELKGGAQTSFTCVKPAKGLDHLLAAGTTRGAVHLLDLRVKQGYIGAITGYNGAVTSLAPMGVGSDSTIASACLDGNLRVHCVKTKKLLYKIYMKVALKGILTQPTILKKVELKESEEEDVADADLDNIFATMETIDDNDDDSNTQHEKVIKKNTKTNSQKPKREQSKVEMEDDEVKITLLEIKPAELQRLWKQDIATLISTDPFKRHMDYLLTKEIKIEDENEVVQSTSVIDEIMEDNDESFAEKKKIKRNNDEILYDDKDIDDITQVKLNTKRNKSSNTETKLKGISIIEVPSKSKVSKHFGKKKSKKTIIRIKGVVK